MDTIDKLEKVRNSIRNTMISNIGIEITDVDEGFVCGRMPIDERTIQPLGLLHGGASVALAESLGSIAGSMQVDPEKELVMGIEVNANHIKAIEKGWVYGKALPVKIGKKNQVWEIKITNERKKIICISRLILAVVKIK